MKAFVCRAVSKTVAVGFLGLALAATSFGQGEDSRDGNERTIVGTWRTQVTARNCQTDSPLFTLHGMFMFNKGGTMSEYGISPGQTPALRSPGNGVWQREQGWQTYSSTFLFYRYDGNGGFIGSQKVKATLHLGTSGDDFTANSSIQILDVNDNVIATACGTSIGTRFE